MVLGEVCGDLGGLRWFAVIRWLPTYSSNLGLVSKGVVIISP